MCRDIEYSKRRAVCEHTLVESTNTYTHANVHTCAHIHVWFQFHINLRLFCVHIRTYIHTHTPILQPRPTFSLTRTLSCTFIIVRAHSRSHSRTPKKLMSCAYFGFHCTLASVYYTSRRGREWRRNRKERGRKSSARVCVRANSEYISIYIRAARRCCTTERHAAASAHSFSRSFSSAEAHMAPDTSWKSEGICTPLLSDSSSSTHFTFPNLPRSIDERKTTVGMSISVIASSCSCTLRTHRAPATNGVLRLSLWTRVCEGHISDWLLSLKTNGSTWSTRSLSCPSSSSSPLFTAIDVRSEGNISAKWWFHQHTHM